MPKSRPKILERRKDSKVLVVALQVSRLHIGKKLRVQPKRRNVAISWACHSNLTRQEIDENGALRKLTTARALRSSLVESTDPTSRERMLGEWGSHTRAIQAPCANRQQQLNALRLRGRNRDTTSEPTLPDAESRLWRCPDKADAL